MRINSSIVSCSALHSYVVWPLLRWYLQYLVMSALGGLRVLRGGGIRSACRASFRRRDQGTLRGTYLENWGGLGSLGLEYDLEGVLSILGTEGV